MKSGTHGGEEAATKLYIQIQDYISVLGDAEGYRTFVHIYFDFDALLARFPDLGSGKDDKAGVLRQFISAFNQTYSFFDITLVTNASTPRKLRGKCKSPS